ncbi:MAG: UDP-N-acetylmuramoyl-L-alanine--D-glutamate ligase [Lachnospiraceae bacterium]|nr:UDP-N-acetylmuramoyl-L-alanine--D-glutamate ligase [Lachnospiraceae bacterium]
MIKETQSEGNHLKIAEILSGKKILIWGYGLEGRSVEKFIKKHCEVSSLEVFEGKQDGIDEGKYDLIIKSPGIKADVYNNKYTSSTDLFLEEFSDKIIGVTGTKGKSTTASLLYHVLTDCTDKKILLVGNIGYPCLDTYDRIDEDTVIVYEMSCHQLAHAYRSPHIAVFLNLYEDHLDYYGTRENYFKAKANIALHQNENDYFYAGENVPEISTKAEIHRITKADVMQFETSLFGKHNQYNASVVYKICTDLFNCDGEAVRNSIKRFRGLHHRLEYVATKDGIDYYNDSISTIPEAAIAAAESIPNTGTLLIGGMDRGIDYDILIDYIKEHQDYNYIMMYASGKRVYDAVSDLSCCHYEEDLKAAVEKASQITEKGHAIILSPAAASYGYFKNFEARGNAFCRLIKKETTLTFTGDIAFDHYMKRKWEDKDLISPDIKEMLKASDHVIINVEGALVDDQAEKVKAMEMRLMHTIDPEAVSLFKDINADIWNLCNNHIMDAGAYGLEMSLREAKKCDCQTIGVGMNLEEAKRPVILQEAGGIGMFGVGYQRACRKAEEDKAGCLSWSDMESIQEVITKIKETCRWCVVVAHGGEEFTALPSPYTRDRYLEYLNMGADIVVAHHPHVPMNYELVGDKAIFYSLGNFIFDTDYQRSQYNTEKGIVLQLFFDENGYRFEAKGLRIDRENEHVISDELPVIFQDVPEEEYNKLSPLSAKMFIEATKRQQLFLYPDKYKNATEKDWENNFMEPLRSGRVPGEVLDFYIICPLAEEEKKGGWKESRLEDIKQYILKQMS